MEAVRGVYERWERVISAAALRLFDPAVVFVIGPGFPDAGSYAGVEGIRGYMRGFLEPWDRITISAEELEDAGDTVIATVLQSGVGAGSGVATELHYFQAWTFADGKVVRLQNFRERPS